MLANTYVKQPQLERGNQMEKRLPVAHHCPALALESCASLSRLRYIQHVQMSLFMCLAMGA